MPIWLGLTDPKAMPGDRDSSQILAQLANAILYQ
jgi:hypothetical protein